MSGNQKQRDDEHDRKVEDISKWMGTLTPEQVLEFQHKIALFTSEGFHPGRQWGHSGTHRGPCGIGQHHHHDAFCEKPLDLRLYAMLLRSLIASAKVCLAETNANRGDPQNWPAGQEWDGLGQSSKETFMTMARERAGISTQEYREMQQQYPYLLTDDLDEIWKTGNL